MAVIVSFIRRAQATGRDFSSFGPEEERTFGNHEQTMLSNGRRAGILGFGVAGVLFLLGAGIAGFLYSPCTKYCERPPGGCKTEAQLAEFHRGCEASCSNLEKKKGTVYVEVSRRDRDGHR